MDEEEYDDGRGKLHLVAVVAREHFFIEKLLDVKLVGVFLVHVIFLLETVE